MSKDYYKTLGVEKTASKDDIRKAYKKLAKKYHPDISKEPDAEAKFKEINEAAAILGDDQKRANYDQYGTADSSGFGGQGFSGFDFSNFSEGFNMDFGDVFDMFFGSGRRSSSGPARGSDLGYNLEITLEEAAFGATKHIIIPKLETCSKCHGTGAASDSDLKVCDTCHGSGTIRRTQRTPFGMFSTSSSCRKCSGQGKVIKEPCPVCDGAGRVEKQKKIEIKIPAGVDEGTKLRVHGEGEAGAKGGPSGDLFVVITILPHETFSREGSDIYVDVPISFAQACLGDEIEVPTLDGKAKLTLPAGTQSHTIFKMRGKGIPSLRGYGSGSEFVRVILETPKKLTKEQKESLLKFDSSANKKKKGFLEKVFE